MKTEVRRALKASIEHWERMINWVVENCRPDDEVDDDEMRAILGEAWYGDDCRLCDLFDQDCGKCITACGPGSLWYRFKTARNWKQWLITARQVKAELEKLDV